MVARCTDTFLVSDIGTCLILKLCGFVEEYRAEIRDVSENHLRLRLGGTWFQRILGDGSLGHPLDLEIAFVPVEATSGTRSLARDDILVKDAQLVSLSPRFESAARRVLWQLRNHLMVVG